MQAKDKNALGMGQGIVVALAGLLITLFGEHMIHRLPPWFGWLLVLVGVVGFWICLGRYRRSKGPF